MQVPPEWVIPSLVKLDVEGLQKDLPSSYGTRMPAEASEWWKDYIRNLDKLEKVSVQYLTLKWLMYFPPVGAKGGWVLQQTTFPVEFLDKNCTIDRVHQTMIIREKSWKQCSVSKWQPFYWFSFCVIAQYHKYWKNTFPKANFNKIWLKVADH